MGANKESQSASTRNEIRLDRRKEVQLVTIACVAAALAFATNETQNLGFNLFTAQLMVVAIALFSVYQNASHKHTSHS